MLNRQIYEEASDWFVRMRTGEDELSLRSELMTWLRRSPEHVAAYLDIAAIWSEVKHVEVDSTLPLEARIAQAREDRGVVADLTAEIRAPLRRRALQSQWAAVAAGVLVVLAGVAAWWQYSRQSYSTGLNEQRSIPLADGSTVELNSNSRIRVHYTTRDRDIELFNGQALFHVAKDSQRPFVVRVNGTSVRALGTVFDVYQKHNSQVVTVIEGTVEVARSSSMLSRLGSGSDSVNAPSPTDAATPLSTGSIRLSAGKQVVVNEGATSKPESANIAAAVAWTQHHLIFEFTPLAEVADEFNRYNARPLVIEGPRLREFKVSAIFKSTDTTSFVRYIQTIPDVQVKETPGTIEIVSGHE